MVFKFQGQYPQILERIFQYLGRQALPVVMIERDRGFVDFVIKKFGTSTLTFSTKTIECPADKTPTYQPSVVFSLNKEVISWWHKGKIKGVKNEICKMVEELGGEVINAG